MVRVRIAPSPTGDPHVGTAYISLFNYVFAKQNKGKFILRIEDTDRERYVKGSEQQIFQSLKWLGLTYDEGPDVDGPHGPYRQSERLDLYKSYALELVKKGDAYYCFCTSERLAKMREEQQKKGFPPKYDRHCLALSGKEISQRLAENTSYIIRMKIPEGGKTVVNDLVRGKVEFENSLIDDQVLLKSDGYPTYHLANVVDDHLMEITHVIRAEEWLSSTPKHVILYEMFGWKLPEFAHMSLLRKPDHSKISKRKDPTSLLWYKEQGYLPEALLNFLALLGWSHPRGEDIFGVREMIKVFSIGDINKAGPVFDLRKLDWLNGVYIRKLTENEFFERLSETGAGKGFSKIEVRRLFPLVRDRLKTLSEFRQAVDFFYWKDLEYGKELVSRKRNGEETKKVLKLLQSEFKKVRKWDKDSLEEVGRGLMGETGWEASELFMTIRVAVTGKSVTPPLFETMEVLGKEKTLKRLSSAINYLH